jgi:hypothetical protein
MSRSPVALRRERDLQLTPVQQHGLRARLAAAARRIGSGRVLAIATGAVLAALVLVTLPAFPGPIALRLVVALLGAALIVAWIFQEHLLAIASRKLEGPAAGWEQLSSAGRLARLLLTVLGTALFVAPFAWFAWKALG